MTYKLYGFHEISETHMAAARRIGNILFDDWRHHKPRLNFGSYYVDVNPIWAKC